MNNVTVVEQDVLTLKEIVRNSDNHILICKPKPDVSVEDKRDKVSTLSSSESRTDG